MAKIKMKSIEEQCNDIVRDLTKIRESKGITTAELEKMTGIRQPNITRMETFKSLPSLQTLLKITTALQVQLIIK